MPKFFFWRFQMKKILLLTTMSLLLIFLNCATIAYGPFGVLFTSSTIGSAASGKEGNKTGEACAHSILGLVAFGDASIQKAKLAGGINDVTTVEHSIFSILAVYGKMCTIVKGN